MRAILKESFAYIDEHDFVWRTYDASLLPVSYRRNALDHADSIEEIHPRELVALMAEVRTQACGLDSADELYREALRHRPGFYRGPLRPLRRLHEKGAFNLKAR